MKTKPKKISDDDLVKIHDFYAQQEANDFATKFKDGIKQEKINDYMRDKYIIHNPSLKGSDIIKKYYKLERNNQMTTEKDVDDFFKKHNISSDNKPELKEDKKKPEPNEYNNKSRLLKYIDTKWFDEPEYIKIRKIKLLKNRVIKKINSGEFTHKKEINKYIKAYNAKNYNPDKYI